jgi:hypothetical protein
MPGTSQIPPEGFHPDLVVEATNVCDRVCPGCYAPNVLAKPGATAAPRAAVFLDPHHLWTLLAELSSWVRKPLGIVAIRGGEPTLHPQVHELIAAAAAHALEVYLETHGRWLLQDDVPGRWRELLATLRRTGATLKVSFDSMHGLAVHELAAITAQLDGAGIPYVIAITEATPTAFEVTARVLPSTLSGRLLYQRKATRLSELVCPPLGVISAAGTLTSTLTAKRSFRAEALP